MLDNARKLLENITPLKTDCGRVCGGACCRSLEGDMTGMLLFPGEEDFYEDAESFSMQPVPGGLLLTCSGTCDRALRPLACRMFPLLPLVREEGIRVAVDARSRAVCPLSKHGKDGLDPTFVEAVKQVGELLVQDPVQADFLRQLTKEHDELVALRKMMRGR